MSEKEYDPLKIYPPRIVEVKTKLSGEIYVFNKKYLRKLLTNPEKLTVTKDLFIKAKKPKGIAIIEHSTVSGCDAVYGCEVPYQLGYSNVWADELISDSENWHHELMPGFVEPVSYHIGRDNHPNVKASDLAFDYIRKHFEFGGINATYADWFHWREDLFNVYTLKGEKLEPAPRWGKCYECLRGIHKLRRLEYDADALQRYLAKIEEQLREHELLRRKKEELLQKLSIIKSQIALQKQWVELHTPKEVVK